MTKQDEVKIRKMIQGQIDKALKSERKLRASEIKTEISVTWKKHEKEIKTFMKKELDKLDKEKMSKEDIKTIIGKAFIRQYRFMWEKGKFVTSYLNDI